MQDCDLCIALGCYLLPEVFPHLGAIFKASTKIIHIDVDPANIAKNHRVDVSYVGSPGTFLRELTPILNSVYMDSDIKAANIRKERFEAASPVINNSIDEIYQTVPVHPFEKYDDKTTYMASGYFFKVLSEKLPENSILFDEALTNSPPLGHHLPGKKTGDKLLTRGGSLGTGFPGAIGAKAAYPDRTVIGFSGDGGSMYTIQCLWTAVRHGINAKFVVCQNRSYRLLQANITQFWKERGISGRAFPTAFDLSFPEIHFDDIAKSFGMDAERIWSPAQVPEAIDRMLAANSPYLINLVLEGDIKPELVGVHCGQ
jgi:benzoylformate decarboxylase